MHGRTLICRQCPAKGLRATLGSVQPGRQQSWEQGARLVVLDLIDGSVDKAPLRAAAILRVQQHVVARPAIARQQTIGLQQTERCAVRTQHMTPYAATPGLKVVDPLQLPVARA